MDKKLKILFVNKFLYPRGGAETYVFDLAGCLERQGHTVEYFGMEHSRNIVTNSQGLQVKNMEFRNKSLKQVFYPFKIIYSIEAKKKIGKLIRAVRPDIVHLNNYNFQLTPSILYEIKKYNIPVVVTLHDFQLVCPNHMLYMEHVRKLCEDCKGRKYSSCINHRCIHGSRIKSVLGALEARLYFGLRTYEKYVDCFIAPSHFLKNKIVEFGEQESRIKVIHNFVTHTGQDCNESREQYVLYFGRLSIQKGIRTLIETCRRLPGVNFVVAGRGELAGELAGIENINYVGHKNGEELKNLIKNAMFSVCPSECYENCPMSVLESQMYGTPVIGANIGGIPELVGDETDGLLFEPGNAEDLSQKIRFLAGNDRLLKEYSQRCLEKAKNFSIEKYSDTLMEIYQTAIQKHSDKCRQAAE